MDAILHCLVDEVRVGRREAAASHRAVEGGAGLDGQLVGRKVLGAEREGLGELGAPARREQRRIDAAQPITEDVLVQSGVLRRSRDGIRVLAKGEITSAVTLQVTGASAGAVAAVEAAGGTLTVAQAAEPADTAA